MTKRVLHAAENPPAEAPRPTYPGVQTAVFRSIYGTWRYHLLRPLPRPRTGIESGARTYCGLTIMDGDDWDLQSPGRVDVCAACARGARGIANGGRRTPTPG